MRNVTFRILLTAVLAAAGIVFILSAEPAAPALQYPKTATVDQTDEYHGTQVADPYRWLEDDKAPAVAAWVQEQNALTFGYLGQIPYRDAIRLRLETLMNYPRYGAPFRAGAYYFFSKNDGLQNQSVIYRQKGLTGVPVVFLDPNTLSKDGTTRASLTGFSQDDGYVVVRHSAAGSDWGELKVMGVASGRELPDRLQWVKFSGAAWRGNGFYYSRYDAPKPGEELTARNENQKIYFHKLGDPQGKDRLVFEDPAHPLRYHGAEVTEDGRYLIISSSEGTHGNEVRVLDLKQKDGKLEVLCPGFEHNCSVIDNVGERFLVHTDHEAPNYRVVLVDPRRPEPENWQTVVAEKKDVLSGASAAGGKLFCTYLVDVSTRVYQHALTGRLEKEIELPGSGSAGGFYGKRKDTTLFYTFTNFTYPPVIFKYDLKTGRSEQFRRTELPFDPAAFEAKQVFYPSKDGTKIPMFIVHKKGLALSGDNPTYLYAYGGFNASMTPSFSATLMLWLESGGVYAMANLRGGGEYGESWHQAGMRDKKQNVFDDFIAAAEYLIREKYTSSDRLAIAGGSNGGLLVGACMTQRPELYQVALPAVGVMDMLRFHKFTVGWGWTVEYGTSDDPDQFRYLKAYSPLHNLKPGVRYPATLVTTADHDDRVVPAHSFKFIATLQACQAGPDPVLIRIETRSGHGASSLTKGLDLQADTWAFTFWNMGVKPKVGE
jgi:prolyl oligopeptidase